MRIIWFWKLAQVFAAISAIWSVLRTNKFCGELNPPENITSCELIEKLPEWNSVNAILPSLDTDQKGVKDEPKAEETDRDKNCTDDPTNSSDMNAQLSCRIRGCIQPDISDMDGDDPALTMYGMMIASVVCIALHLITLVAQFVLLFCKPNYQDNGLSTIFSAYGAVLWVLAFVYVLCTHLDWDSFWCAMKLPVQPQFPKQWISLEVLTVIMVIQLCIEPFVQKYLIAHIHLEYSFYLNYLAIPTVSRKNDETRL